MINLDPNRIPIIVGATGVGKTDLGLRLALEHGYSIVSADSMQVYRGMDIGTAKLSQDSQRLVHHYLIDIINPDEAWSLHHFLKASSPILESNSKVMIVGGTGLYIRALLQGFQLPAINVDLSFRDKLSQRSEIEGLWTLHHELELKDPESAALIKPTDAYRIIRALEIIEHSGEKASKTKRRSDDSHRFQLIILNRPRDIIYQRIESRVDHMIEQGLLDEVKQLLGMGYDPSLSSLQALGYKEMIAFLEGQMNWSDTVALIKKRTRNFAKRQLTWYRSFKNAQWLEL